MHSSSALPYKDLKHTRADLGRGGGAGVGHGPPLEMVRPHGQAGEKEPTCISVTV